MVAWLVLLGCSYAFASVCTPICSMAACKAFGDPDAYWQSKTSVPDSRCLNSSLIAAEFAQVTPLRSVKFAAATQPDFGFTESAHCAIGRWYCSILACHYTLNVNRTREGKVTVPMHVPAWLLYMGLNCEATLLKWFPEKFAAVCTPEVRDMLHSGITDDFFYWSAEPFSTINDWDDEFQFDVLFHAAETLDKMYSKRHSQVLMMQDSGVNQALIDSAVRKDIKYALVGQNPLSYLPSTHRATSRYGFRWEPTVRQQMILSFLHPLSYGNVVCESCAAPISLDINGWIEVEKGTERHALLTVIFNENSGGILEATTATFGSYENFLSNFTSLLVAKKLLQAGHAPQPTSLDAFFRGSSPALGSKTPVAEPNWLQGQQWLAQQVSDPNVVKWYSAIGSVMEKHKEVVKANYMGEALGSLALVEHNYGVDPGRPFYREGVEDKYSWVKVWEKTDLANEVAAAINATNPPQTVPVPNLTACGDTCFLLSPTGQVLNISLCDGTPLWSGTWIDSHTYVPVVQFSYISPPTSVSSGYIDKNDGYCQFVLNLGYTAGLQSEAGGVGGEKIVNVTAIFTFHLEYAGTLSLEIVAASRENSPYVGQGSARAKDALLVSFAPAAPGEWKVQRRRGDIPLSANGPCSGRKFPVRENPPARPTLGIGAFTVSSDYSPVVVLADNQTATYQDFNGIRLVQPSPLTNLFANYELPPYPSLGLSFVLWDSQECCWAVDSPFPTLVGGFWLGRASWNFELRGPLPVSCPRTAACPRPAAQPAAQPFPIRPSVVGFKPITTNNTAFFWSANFLVSPITIVTTPLVPFTILPPHYTFNTPLALNNTYYIFVTGSDDNSSTALVIPDWDPTKATTTPLAVGTPFDPYCPAPPVAVTFAVAVTPDNNGFLLLASAQADPIRALRLFHLDKQLRLTRSVALDPSLPPYACPAPHQLLIHPTIPDAVILVEGAIELPRVWVISALNGTTLFSTQVAPDFYGNQGIYPWIVYNTSIFVADYYNGVVNKFPVSALEMPFISPPPFTKNVKELGNYRWDIGQPNTMYVDKSGDYLVGRYMLFDPFGRETQTRTFFIFDVQTGKLLDYNSYNISGSLIVGYTTLVSR